MDGNEQVLFSLKDGGSFAHHFEVVVATFFHQKVNDFKIRAGSTGSVISCTAFLVPL